MQASARDVATGQEAAGAGQRPIGSLQRQRLEIQEPIERLAAFSLEDEVVDAGAALHVAGEDRARFEGKGVGVAALEGNREPAVEAGDRTAVEDRTGAAEVDAH